MREPDISAVQAASLVAENSTVLVDVRTAEEWREGHAPCAVHIPLDELTELSVPRSCRVLTICRSGRRSAIAADRVAPTHRVCNVTGGMMSWTDHGLPIATGRQGNTAT